MLVSFKIIYSIKIKNFDFYSFRYNNILSVIRPKSESQNECFKKTNYPKNEHFVPANTHTYVRISG